MNLMPGDLDDNAHNQPPVPESELPDSRATRRMAIQFGIAVLGGMLLLAVLIVLSSMHVEAPQP